MSRNNLVGQEGDMCGSLGSDAAGLALDSLADGVYVTDLDRKIVVWNEAAERITGWSGRDVVGSSCLDDLLAHEDIDGNKLCGEESCPLHRAILSGEASTFPQILFARTRAGRRVPVAVSVAPVRGRDGVIVGGVESFRDLSRLVQDLRRGRVIQEHAMEAALPDDKHVDFEIRNIPHEYVSGDFCRVEQIQPGCYGIMLADVMGHGVAAALHTMQIRSLWEEARDTLSNPGLFMTHLNEKLYRLTEHEDFFATVFYCLLDSEERTLRYASAGHPSPILLRGGDGIALDQKSVALGLTDDVEYSSVAQQLKPEDMLLLYSDGAIETVDARGRELGREGLVSIVTRIVNDRSLDFVLDRLVRDVRDYCGHLTFQDDVSFIAMQIH